jgi:hypothetical protein
MLARDIVRIKSQSGKMTEFVGQLKAVTLRISSVSTLNELSSAMEEAGKAISLVSGNLDTKRLAEISKNLAKEDAKLDMKQDMMEDILDGLGESMDDPVEQEKIYQQVLRDVGLEVENVMPEASSKTVKKEEIKAEVRYMVNYVGDRHPG